MFNGSNRDRKRRSSSEAKRAAVLRVALQVAHDRERRVAPKITLPRITCLDDGAPPDVGANATRLRYD
jgi:hypothetical protein